MKGRSIEISYKNLLALCVYKINVCDRHVCVCACVREFKNQQRAKEAKACPSGSVLYLAASPSGTRGKTRTMKEMFHFL